MLSLSFLRGYFYMANYLRKTVLEGQELINLEENQVMWKGTSNFGIKGNNNTGITISDKVLERHILFLGSIGSGKSVTLYHLIKGIRNHCTVDDVFIFFDAKGDYLKEFYEAKDIILSNEAVKTEGMVNWNIFEDILATPEAKREEIIWEIASTIFNEDIKNSSSPIFAIGAKDIFAAILIAIIRDSLESGEKWDHEKFIDWLRAVDDSKLRNLLLKHKDLKWVRNYIRKDSNTQTIQSFMMHVYQSVFSIFTGEFAKAGDFSITKSIQSRGGKAIFLEYDIASANILKPIYTLLLDIAMKNALSQKENNRRGNVIFILDEFPLIPKLNYMDNVLNFGRSLGIKIIAGIQNIGQVKHVYTSELGESILSGFGTIFSFRLFDSSSRNMLSNRHGRTKKMITYAQSNSNKGVQDMVIDGRVIEDWDITELSIGECIVSPFNGEPFKFFPINYTKKD